MINYDTDRGVTVTKDKTGSTMSLSNAVAADSGNYTCMPHNIHPASVLVHVLGEGNSAAQLMSSVEQKMGVVSADTSSSLEAGSKVGNTNSNRQSQSPPSAAVHSGARGASKMTSKTASTLASKVASIKVIIIAVFLLWTS